jgi:hypothetical protein
MATGTPRRSPSQPPSADETDERRAVALAFAVILAAAILFLFAQIAPQSANLI